jgi:hypothetical protein
MPDKQPLEILVHADVYDSAMARARSQGQQLATVARTVLYQEAARTPEGAPVPDSVPPRRQYGDARKPIKFKVDASSYREAKGKILASGRSVAAAIEDGLAVFARTGTVESHVPIDPAPVTETR